MPPNQNPEQIARDAIDAMLRAAGWAVQDKSTINLHEGQGQAVREYTTDSGPADYVLFIDTKPIGIIEAKKDTLGYNMTGVEGQTEKYATSKLQWIEKGQPPPVPLRIHRHHHPLHRPARSQAPLARGLHLLSPRDPA